MQATAPATSTAAEIFSAQDRLPIASVIAPVTIGPTIWPTLKATVIVAIDFGQAPGGEFRRENDVVDETTAKKALPKITAEIARISGELPINGITAPIAVIAISKAVTRPVPALAMTLPQTQGCANAPRPRQIQKALCAHSPPPALRT